jgi:hypothetical protein
MKKVYLLLLVALIAVSACKSKEEEKNDAEATSKFLTEKKARIAKGVGEAMKGEGKEAAASVSEGAGEVLKGGSSGFDKSLVKVTVEADKVLIDKGIEVSRAARLPELNSKGQEGITVYVICNKTFGGTLLMKAYDASGEEVGRSSAALKGGVDSAQYVNFYFDNRTPLNVVKKYSLKQK